jgi:hypothetical protein
VRHGLAMDSLQYLLDNGEGGRYCSHLGLQALVSF